MVSEAGDGELRALEAAFVAGDYARVLAAGLDRGQWLAHPYTVGALAFSGRIDEAVAAAALAESQGSDEADTTSAAVNFFVVAGYCHAGRQRLAMRLARENLRFRRHTSALARFYAYQGMALVRYFQGRLDASTLHARQALRASVLCGDAFARLLALDLRGHLLLQQGDSFAGLRQLEQARSLADNIGAGKHAQSIGASLVGYRSSRRLERKRSQEELEALAADEDLPYFARRNLLFEVARERALRGRKADAIEALEAGSAIALPDSDTRGRVRKLLARALLSYLHEGIEAAREPLAQAHELAAADKGLLVEVVFAQNALMPRLALIPEDRVRQLAAETQLHRARAAGYCYGDELTRGEDRLVDTLRNLQTLSLPRQIRVLIDEELLGLLPNVLDRDPGRFLLPIEGHLIQADYGEVSIGAAPSGPSLRLLHSLQSGPKSREELMLEVWDIRNYAPNLHDGTISTAAARLRASLGARSHWLVTTRDGYLLQPGVNVLRIEEVAQTSAPRSESESEPVEANTADEGADREDTVLSLAAEQGEVSCSDIASKLQLSRASALRLLRKLVEDDALLRIGKGKRTRYLPRGEHTNTHAESNLA